MKITVFLLSFLYAVGGFAQKEYNISFDENTIHFKTFGSKGSPVLIINGGPGMNSNGFAKLAEIISKEHCVIIYDQRGTGKSTMKAVNSETITLDKMVADIEQIRTHLGYRSWAVLGHSFGGMMVSYYATKHPSKIDKIVFSSSGGVDLGLFKDFSLSRTLTAFEQDSLKYWEGRIREGDTSKYTRLQRATVLASAYLYADKDTYIKIIAERLTQTNYQVNNLVFENMRKIGFDCKEGLKTFKKPVLVIQGKQDVISTEIASNIHKLFSNSKLVLMDKCGHYGWLEQPDIYITEVMQFLKSKK